MHIALITHYYPPEVNAPAQRAFDHAQAWLKAGHSVTIVTAAPSHPYGVVYKGFKNETSENLEGTVRVLRLKTLLGKNSGTFNRIKNYLSFFLAVALNVKKIGPIDCVISTSPQFFCGLAGAVVKRAMGVPWIFEIRDIWPDSIVAVGAAKPNLMTSIVGRMAKWAYRRADHIVSVSPGFSDHFRAYEVPEEKITLIPNGITVGLAPTQCNWNEFPELENHDGKFTAAFIGTLGMAHGLDTIIGAAKLLQENANIGFLLVGSGAQKQHLESSINDSGLNNITVLDQQPRDRILKLWSLVSVSIVHLKKNDVFKSVIPTKLLEAMAMSKPVVLGVEGTAASIVNEAECGICIEPENSEQLASSIVALSINPELVLEMAENGRRHVLGNFDRIQMAHRYLELIKQLELDNSSNENRHKATLN